MTIYSKKEKGYRKIWEQHHGPIPKDEFGRPYDIHHIDGDHNNNSIENLMAVSIQEHYNIHESQGDWGACNAIVLRMGLSPKLLSELARKAALKRVDEGTFHLLKQNGGSELARERALKRVADGSHHLLKQNGGSERARERELKKIEEGRHNLLGNVTCRDRQGNVVQVPKDIYQKQKEVTKDMTQWEFAIVGCPEGKKRKVLSQIIR